MRLLPTAATAAQQKALSALAAGKVAAFEPCDCGDQIRHNNGGNYHQEWHYRLDGGKCYKATTFSGDYGPPLEWEEIAFSEAIDEIAEKAAEGWHIKTS